MENIGKIIDELSKKIQKPLKEIEKYISETGIPRPNKWIGFSIDENGKIENIVNMSAVAEKLEECNKLT